MTQVTIRNLPPDVIERLKQRARVHGRSLEGELRSVLIDAAWLSRDEILREADDIARRLRGRRHSDSAQLIREDRDR